MSDKSDASDAVATAGSPNFTERELTILSAAWRCLKSGPPEIDYDALAAALGMTNKRSAVNAWAKIKKQLVAAAPEGGAPPTPKKGGKKTAAKADADAGADGDAPATPKKTPRKRAPKKQDVDGEENASPKKRSRPAKKSAETIREEPEEEDNKEAATDGDAMDEVPDEV